MDDAPRRRSRRRRQQAGAGGGPLALLATVLVVVAAILVGIWLGGHPSDLPGFMRSAFEGEHGSRVTTEAIEAIEHTYYRPVGRRSLVGASIAGAVASLDDPFSHYLSPSEYHGFAVAAHFSGIGVEVVDRPSGLRIERVFDASPAQRAGLTAGEVIVAVDGRSLRGVPEQDARGLIIGKPGTDVVLTLRDGARTKQVTVTREIVSEPVVAAETRTVDGRKVAVLLLATFSAGAHGELREALERELHDGARGVVLDLRHNGGGLVSEARLVASIFIPKGVIVTMRSRTQPTLTLSAAGGAIPASIPMVVLVDRDTASAAEIVTGALQDDHRATVVGTHTFGKGVFQELEPLSNGGALDITVGEYFTPNGRNLGGGGVKEGAGITPEVSVPEAKIDTPQGLDAALRVLAAKMR